MKIFNFFRNFTLKRGIYNAKYLNVKTKKATKKCIVQGDSSVVKNTEIETLELKVQLLPI